MGSVSLGGDIKRLNHHLRRLSTVNFADVSATLADAMRTGTRERFKTQTAPDSKPWKQSIRAKAEGGVTLTKTARLKNSIRGKSDASGFAVGTNVIYARRHQFGDRTPLTIRAKTGRGLRFKVGGRWVNTDSVKVQLPARPFLGISEADLEEIKGTLEAFIDHA